MQLNDFEINESMKSIKKIFLQHTNKRLDDESTTYTGISFYNDEKTIITSQANTE